MFRSDNNQNFGLRTRLGLIGMRQLSWKRRPFTIHRSRYVDIVVVVVIIMKKTFI